MIALVANPDSGDGAAGRAERLLRAGAEVEVFPPDRAEAAAASGAERVAIAGGDGSIAAAASAAGKAGIPVAVIPTGTANDFAAAAGLPGDVEQACALALRGGRRRRMDLARLGERPFVNVAGAGLPPSAARRASGLKSALGAQPGVAVAECRTARLELPPGTELNVDGELVESGPVEARIEPAAFELVVA